MRTRPAPRIEQVAPLSPAQHGLWFLDQLTGPSSEYVLPYAHRLRGPLDIPALEDALNGLLKRHETLRTRVDQTADEPRQTVLRHRPGRLRRLDLTQDPAQAGREAADFALRPFDLEGEDPLRTLLIRLGAQDHLLVCSLHHICCDGLSLAVLGEDLAALYRAASHGQKTEEALPPLPLHYRDTVLARAEQAGSPAGRLALARWRTRLEDAAPLRMPTDHARPEVRTARGDRVEVTVPADVTSAARTFAGRHRVTLYMVLLTVFAMLLHRRGGGRDLCVGTPVSGRSTPEEEALVGLFTNTVVLRLDLSGDREPAELLHQVRGRALAAYQDGHVPFEHVVDELRPPRDLSRTPVFQVMFSFQDFEEDALALDGLRCTPWDIPVGSSKFDLELELGRDGDRLRGFLEYSTDLYEAHTVRVMADEYLALLREALGLPGA
ncbi:condensation domain-containing protein [Streptosporangium sp. NPDC050855]|uniref:condensation domain-containing protein n=1 Tax=Streptosporangium sp. NPDC050855 TaxID=3366194 RepID=UPI0037ADEEA1